MFKDLYAAIKGRSKPATQGVQTKGAQTPFYMQVDGKIKHCEACQKEIRHPAVLIPLGKPVLTPIKIGEKNLLKWHWDYGCYHIGCAKKAVKRLDERAMTP